MLRAQCNDCQRFDPVIWHKPHAPALGERGDEEDAFHPGEAFADAAAWATAERKICELRLASARFHSPALRVETFRLLEETGVAERHIWTQEHERLCWDSVFDK